MLSPMSILVYLAPLRIDLTQFVTLYPVLFLPCCALNSLFIITYVASYIYNVKKKEHQYLNVLIITQSCIHFTELHTNFCFPHIHCSF